MQINSVYLYPNRINVFTNYAGSDDFALDTWKTERYRRVYNQNLKLYRSVDNRLDIQVRNSDQKPATYSGTTLVFNLIARDGKDLVLAKDITEMDVNQGTARIYITETDLLDIEPGTYQYSLTQERRADIDGGYTVISRSPLYFDTQHGAIGTVELVGDVLGYSEPSVLIDKFMYINPFSTGDVEPKYYTSSIVDAEPLISTPQSFHTFQFYLTGYTGRIDIEASLDQQGATPKNWSIIESFTPTADRVYKNVEGKYNWFRIKHFPTAGTLDKVLYR